METSLVNLFGISVVAFAVPFVLGFFPTLRVPALVLEVVTGIIVGPSVLGWIEIDEPVGLMATLGVAFLLFLAGMELDLQALRGRPLRLGAAGFLLSLVIALIAAVALGEANIVVTPLLVAVALSATSVGIVIPVLSDTGNLHTDVGKLTVAGGSAAEFGTIVLLGLLFAFPFETALEGFFEVFFRSIALAVFAVAITLILWLLSKAVRWETGLRVARQLDETSSQLRTRFAVMLLLGAAVLAAGFGFEAILGTFLAGIFVGTLIKGDPNEKLYRSRLEAIGFGFFVPVFFISSGMGLDVAGVFTADELGRVAIFLLLLLAARGLPALLYRKSLTGREVTASGLMQATNLSFVVVAVTVGLSLDEITRITGSSLIIAGLLSAVLFPALAQGLLAREAAVRKGDS
jgi:Kef-type K+ transport system membrane component KefB